MESNDRPIFPGIASGVLNVSASSEYDPSSAAYRCRLDYQNREGSQSWRAGSDNLEQYFQVSSPFPYRFHEIITKGGGSTEQWVRSYLIKYTLTGANWKYYNNCEKLKANEDTNSYHGNTLKSFVARVIRIYPTDYHLHIAMRIEVMISENTGESIDDFRINNIFPAVELGFPVTASSVYSPSYGPDRLRLNYNMNREGGKSWIPAIQDINQWALVSSMVPKQWRQLCIQGDSNGNWVKSFYLSYTPDGKTWHVYNSKEMLIANTNDSSIVSVHLIPIIARSIKIHPVSWKNYISMRLEAYFID